ncbi:serine hydrolase [Flavihumibacter fluvii]|uniref:serine hydrolase n=1 Tax=Flavihumibacter fluvii TaxID=2838157 RepID=UPI001BDF4216|nr:serine hydrolase [Flavihumibacter fluvii]ULQ53855.1 serine hydrolase [Flavihumibacter fluvii]
MRRYIILLIVFLNASLSNAQTKKQKLEELLGSYARQEKFNGSVLVAINGEVLLDKGYGWQDIVAATANTPQTQYQVGSVTKQFTTAVIMKLQEQGKLKVTDKLSKYFPDYPKGDSITIEQLMTHTSGIYNYTNDENFMKNEVTKPHNQDEIIALFKNKPLDFSPGKNWSYSNSGYCLLGYIIEKVTGKPYEKNVREIIFQPTEMSSSGFDFTHLNGASKATGYLQYSGKTSPLAPIVDSSVSFSAGAIYSTTNDLYKWTKAVMAQKIIRPESWKSSLTPKLHNYGYGWAVDSLEGQLSFQHGGGIHGFNSNLVILPDQKISIVLLSNVNTPMLGEITKSLADILLDKPYTLPGERKAIDVAEKTLQELVGEYKFTPDFIITTTVENGKIYAQATNQPKFELFCEKPDLYFLKVVEAQLEFKRDATGKVDQLILHQGGKDLPAKKTK